MSSPQTITSKGANDHGHYTLPVTIYSIPLPVKLLSPIKVSEEENSHGTVPNDKENILKRNFEVETSNQKWCFDGRYCIHLARREIFEYTEGWYNRKRIHSAIDYMTPQQKEDEELKK